MISNTLVILNIFTTYKLVVVQHAYKIVVMNSTTICDKSDGSHSLEFKDP